MSGYRISNLWYVASATLYTRVHLSVVTRTLELSEVDWMAAPRGLAANVKSVFIYSEPGGREPEAPLGAEEPRERTL